MTRRTKLYSELNFCGLVAPLMALARALRGECCACTAGGTAACIPATSQTAPGIWRYLSDPQLPPCFRTMETMMQGITLVYSGLCQRCHAVLARPRVSIHPPVPGREGALSPLTPGHREPRSDAMQYVKFLPRILLLLISTLLLCQQEKKPAGFAFKAPSSP